MYGLERQHQELGFHPTVRYYLKRVLGLGRPDKNEIMGR